MEKGLQPYIYSFSPPAGNSLLRQQALAYPRQGQDATVIHWSFVFEGCVFHDASL